MTERACLILFARVPALGQVKNRLASSLGPQQTLSLYRQMLARQIRLVNSLPNVSRRLVVAGNPEHQALTDFSGSIHMQAEGDIGVRMASALAAALKSHSAAVLIGCDSPGVDRAYLEAAFSCLAAGKEAVFGPATDGGYVLVGLRRMMPALFAGIDWGTVNVMAQTRSRLRQAGWQWQELAAQMDIDEPQDLAMHADLVAREYGIQDKDW